MRTDGTLIARWPPASDGRTRVALNSPISNAIEAGETRGTLELAGTSDREARIASFRRVSGYPLYVVAGVSRDAVFADWVRFISLLGAIVLPITVVLVYVTWVALKKTQREAATATELREEIHRRAAAEQTALQSQKLETLALVTGGVAHDFNNLLAIVSAGLHIIQRKHAVLKDEKQLQAMNRAVQAGVRLTRQLLSFTRKQALRPETLTLQSWLPSVEGLIHSTLGPGIEWQLEVHPDTRAIHVDPAELELALINLVVNARHAMPDGGSLVIRAENELSYQHQRMVAIRVSDTGVGIPDSIRAKVFEPFFTTRDKGTGSGLGLSQVQGFCAASRGSVDIQSAVGVGTTVCMYLPGREPQTNLSEPNHQTAVAAEAPLLPPLSATLLLVEDNEDVASTIETLLRSGGLEVVRLRNADAALEYLDSSTSRRPDLVLSDIAMPGSMDGIRLAFTIQTRFPGLPVILTTGYAERLSEAVQGGLKVLPKPVVPEALFEELRQSLERASQ